jgi:hypothetical protein
MGTPGRRGPYKGRALRSAEEEYARAAGWQRILPLELHLRRADRIIQTEIAEERAEPRSPHLILRRLTAADRRKTQQAIEELLAMIRQSAEVRRELRGQPRLRRVRWENRLWKLVRELRARLEAFPAPQRLHDRQRPAASTAGESVGADRQRSMAAAAAGVPAEILAAYQAEDP